MKKLVFFAIIGSLFIGLKAESKEKQEKKSPAYYKALKECLDTPQWRLDKEARKICTGKHYDFDSDTWNDLAYKQCYVRIRLDKNSSDFQVQCESTADYEDYKYRQKNCNC